MRKDPIIWIALAYLVGCAGGALGREIPVYREYTVPISFGDAPRESTLADAAAPDLVAFQLIRDVQAREALMGKETLLELDFQRGSSAFGASAPISAGGAPALGGAENRREKKSDRNWLVKSLSLPTLGQSPSNAAAAALSVDKNESGWGWLVDEVAKSSDGSTTRQEEWHPEAEESSSLLHDSSAALESARTSETLPQKSFPRETAVQDRHSPNRNAFSDKESARSDPTGQAPDDYTTPKSYRASSDAIVGMSQTRELMAEFSEGARLDFTALRKSLTSISAGPAGSEEIVSPDRMGLDLPSSAGRLSGGRDVSGSSLIDLPKRLGAEASWRGGWSATHVESSVLPATETPLPAAPSASPPVRSPRPSVSSGGYKPAWY